MESVIASEKLLAQRPGEQAFEFIIEVGTPYRIAHDPEEWACPISMKPLHYDLRDAHGNSSLQAICLATTLALHLLQEFKQLGGIVRYPNGTDCPLEAYSVGRMMKMFGG